MNRALRRAYNKSHKTSYTKQDFEAALAMARIRNGIYTKEDFSASKSFSHIDNEKLAPEGIEVMLNYEQIMKRPKDDLLEDFKLFVEQNKDTVFHLTRDEAVDSLVCLKEDDRTTLVDGVLTKKPKWLFDLYNDLLIQKDGVWVSPFDVDEELMDNYTLLDVSE